MPYTGLAYALSVGATAAAGILLGDQVDQMFDSDRIKKRFESGIDELEVRLDRPVQIRSRDDVMKLMRSVQTEGEKNFIETIYRQYLKEYLARK